MAYCAVPDTTTLSTRPATPASLTAPPPNTTSELCDTTVKETTTTPGSTTPSTSTTVAGPPGPPGPPGPAGTGGAPHDGIRWAGPWIDGASYSTSNNNTPRHADVVSVDGALFVCIADHIASVTNRPQLSTYEGDPTLWEEFWQVVLEPGSGNTHTGMTWAGAWADATEYFPSTLNPTRHADVVKESGGLFICKQAHTSSATNKPKISTYTPEAADFVRVDGLIFKCIAEHVSGTTSKPVVPRGADYVIVDGIYFICTAQHISGPTSEPQPYPGEGDPSLWQEFWDQLPTAPTDAVWRGEWVEGEEYFPSNEGDGTPSLWEEFWQMFEERPATGVNWRGEWADGVKYSPTNISSGDPEAWEEYWEMLIEPSAGEQAEVLDKVAGGAFDWMTNATGGSWLKTLLLGAGIALAGAAVLNAFSDDGSGGGTDPDSRYNGSPSYTGEYTPPSIKDVVESLCLHAGIASYDVSMLPDDKYCQFSLSQVTSIRNILDNMSKAFQFDMVDSSGTLKFVPRNQTPVKTLQYDDLAFTSTGETIAPITTKRLQSVDLPRAISLTYISEELDYNNYSQMTEIPTFADGNTVSLSVPFTMTHDDAKATTEQLLIGAHLERLQFTFKTWYKSGIELEPGDVVTLPTGDMVRIIQIEESEEGILEIVAVDAGVPLEPQPIVVGGVTIGYTASTYYGTGQPPQIPSAPSNIAPVIGKSGTLFIDPPVLNSDDINPRVYAAVHGYGVEGWPGAQIFRSVDGGASYTLIGGTSTSATWGLVGTAINAVSQHLWDNTTVITVQLKTGTLVSKTDAAVLAGENLCMVGQECIAFGVATLISPGTYQLSHLLRGRRGTEWAIPNHVANELFVMLDSGIVEIPCTETDRGKTFKYKTVTYGSDLTKVDPIDVQIFGTNTLPWTVANLTLERDTTSQAWTIDWIERPRFNNGLIDYNELLHDEDWGGFSVQIYASAATDAPTVRQEIVYTLPYVYTAAAQIADFNSIQTAITCGVTQVSKKYGGGRERTNRPGNTIGNT